ncbi:MAG: hypothetical protein A2W00_04740 [Candidatus Eisenbacteria bacterium RBG_16_71_46]|nr:MAG: hypothetical protein A2W00_04740 [Candidatus Eisenbacteria bacterium RBG_16_71_46]
MHGFYCYDTVLVVDAMPAELAGVPAPPPAPAGIQTLGPNPFEHGTRISFALDRAEPVDLQVIDLEGRRVRVLAAGQFVGPRAQAVNWDGMRDDGRMAPAGVYWVLMRWPGGVDRRRVVKLH